MLPPRQVLGMRTCRSKLIEDFDTLPCLWHMQLTEYKNSSKTVGSYSALDDEYVIDMVMIDKQIQVLHFHRADYWFPSAH